MNPSSQIKTILSAAEARELARPSDLRGWLALGTSWGIIVGAMALTVSFPGAATYLLALLVVGGRQLALTVLMHEASHRSLFRTRWLNDVVGQLLCAWPTWNDVERYRVHHLAHHRHVGTARDPDLSLASGYPVSRASFLRKVTRDLTGLSGLRRIGALLLVDLGFLAYNVSGVAARLEHNGRTTRDIASTGWRNMRGFVATQAAAALALWSADLLVCLLLWWVAYLTTFSLVLRIRSIAEHAGLGDSPDLLRNTRTVRANALERLFVAPHNVNLHLEHHLLMSVPFYKLPRFHRLLRERGLLTSEVPQASSYGEVLRQVVVR